MLYYDASKNPEGRCFDGVPLRDLTDDELAELPAWLRASVEASEFYTTEAPAQEIDPDILASITGVEVVPGDLAADLAQPATIDPGDGVERIAIEAQADGTTTTLTVEPEQVAEPTRRRR